MSPADGNGEDDGRWMDDADDDDDDGELEEKWSFISL